MSISDRFLEKLKTRSYQEQYYYLQRCLFNVTLMKRKGDGLEMVDMQRQADEIFAVMNPGEVEKAKVPPPWAQTILRKQGKDPGRYPKWRV